MFQISASYIVNLKTARMLTSMILRLFGVDIPRSVTIHGGLILAHGGMGVVIHPSTKIGRNVKIYQQVTIGRSDIWNEQPNTEFRGVTIEDNSIICAGAKVITSTSLQIGKGSIIGANAVLTQSTGPNEIWAGIPARKIGTTDHPEAK